jgi:hypothetical protein
MFCDNVNAQKSTESSFNIQVFKSYKTMSDPIHKIGKTYREHLLKPVSQI